MKEEIISFEAAKLAKKTGFSEACKNWYNFSGLLIKEASTAQYPSNDKRFPSYSAPTQSLLQRWLREKHDLFVSISSWFGRDLEYKYNIEEICIIGDWKRDLKNNYDNESYITYEQALEAGLLEALNIIIKDESNSN